MDGRKCAKYTAESRRNSGLPWKLFTIARYDISVGQLLLKSYSSSEAKIPIDVAGLEITTFITQSVVLVEICPSPKNYIDARICESGSLKMMQAGGIDAKLKTRLPKSSPFEVKMLVEFVRHGISEGGDVQRFHLLEKLLAGIKQPEIGFSTKKLVAI